MSSTATNATPTLSDTNRSTWNVDASHSSVEFSIRHMMVSTVKGRFSELKGSIVDVAEDPTRSSVEIEIPAASITTNDEKRDAHLRSADFLDVEQFPLITFKSTRIEGTRDEFKLTGDLTLHGTTREITLEVTSSGTGTSPYGQTVTGFSGETKLNRKDWGLNWNVGLEAGGVLVSDQLKLSVEIEATKNAS